MEIGASISDVQKTVNTDIHYTKMSEDFCLYALNMCISDFNGNEYVLQNEPSNILCTAIPSNKLVVGYRYIVEQDRLLLFLVSRPKFTTDTKKMVENVFDVSESEIGEIVGFRYNDEHANTSNGAHCGSCFSIDSIANEPLENIAQSNHCNYHKILSSGCLDWNINYPVDIEYKITDCSLQVYFTDGYNEDRYIYFDYEREGNPNGYLKLSNEFKTQIGLDDCCNPVYDGKLNCNKIKFQPIINRVCVEVIDTPNNGSLHTGAYQAFVAYSDEVGNELSEYHFQTNPLSIFSKRLTDDISYNTSKAISFKITNLDTDGAFKYYNLVVLSTINGVQKADLVGTFPVEQNQYTYTGYGLYREIALQDLFSNKVYYKHSKGITKSNNYLFRFGLTEYNKPNLQRVANLVKCFWATTQVPENAYFDAKNTEKYRTYQRDEVVPLAIIFEADNGEDFAINHIPNYTTDYYKQRYGTDLNAEVNNGDVIIDEFCDKNIKKYWQVYNSGNVLGQPHQQYKDCDDTCWEYGEFGYWESTERYPSNGEIWGDLCGKPIRHHKMPDSCISHIHDSLAGSKGFIDNNVIYPIGIKVDHQSVINALKTGLDRGWIRQEDYDRIKSYRIVRGDRTGNKSVVAKGLIYNVNQYTKNDKTYFYPNYPYNDLRADKFLAADKSTYALSDSNYTPLPFNKTTKKYTFHSPDTHFSDPTLATYIKLETEEYGEAEGSFNEAEKQAEYKFISTLSASIAFATGLAAYLSASELKECTTYTVKSCSKEKQESNGFSHIAVTPAAGDVISFNGDLFNNVQNATAVITSNNFAAGTGIYSLRPLKKDTSVGEIKTCYSNPYGNDDGRIQVYNKLGEPISPTTSSLLGAQANNFIGIIKNIYNNGIDGIVDTVKGIVTGTGAAGKTDVESYTKTSCEGTPESILAGNSGNGILRAAFKLLGKAQISRIILALKEIKIARDLIMSMIPYNNFALQYSSVGKYNNYKCISNNKGVKIRKMDFYGHVRPEIESVYINGKTELFNNWNRESSVLLQVADTFPDPSVQDTSRFLAKEVMSSKYDYDLLGQKHKSKISSYYASVKNIVPNQYGSIQSIRYLETGRCSFYLNKTYDCNIVFGGDTYINRFALKIKHSFFTQTRFMLPNDSDVRYQNLGNVAYPAFYFNTEGAQLADLSEVIGEFGFAALFKGQTYQSILNVPKNRLDIDNTNHKTLFFQRGYIHLYNYGVPYFLVESDVNVDYRHGKDNRENDFYPRVSDINEWTQEKNVPITHDNKYFYNPDYSTGNTQTTAAINTNIFQPNKDCKVKHTQRLIYSDRAPELQGNKSFDAWLSYKASNKWDFDLDKGLLVSIDGIENTKILCRFEHGLAIHNAYVTISTNLNVAQIDNNRLFQTNPQQFADTNLGYIGTQHKTILKTEFGHIWADAKRGQIFVLGNNGSGIDEISKDGAFHWFKENLPFEIKKQFPDVDIDNNLKGIGLALCFDKRFRRIFVTKLDYKVLDPSVKYDDVYKEFYIIEGNLKKVISLSNTKYFCNKSWTRAYSLITKTWISFYSFIPNYYIDGIDKFSTGINAIDVGMSSLWTHNLTNKSYQVFYGRLNPFIIEVNTKFDLTNKIIYSVEYSCDVLRYHNEFDFAYINNITYNKAIVSNINQTSGILNLVNIDRNNEYEKSKYPIKHTDSHTIAVCKTDNQLWSFNQFKDITKTHYSNLPLILWNCANSKKSLNLALLNYTNDRIDDNNKLIRKDNGSITFINDKHSNYKFLHKFTLNLNNRSFH